MRYTEVPPGMPSVLMAGGTPGGAPGGGVGGGGDDGGTRGGDGGNGGAGGTGGDGVPQAHPQQSQPYVASSDQRAARVAVPKPVVAVGAVAGARADSRRGWMHGRRQGSCRGRRSHDEGRGAVVTAGEAEVLVGPPRRRPCGFVPSVAVCVVHGEHAGARSHPVRRRVGRPARDRVEALAGERPGHLGRPQAAAHSELRRHKRLEWRQRRQRWYTW